MVRIELQQQAANHQRKVDMTKDNEKPVAIEYWLQDSMESGRWVTTGGMTKATANRLLSDEFSLVYPMARIVEPLEETNAAQRQWVGLTDDEVRKINQKVWGYVSADHARMRGYACAIEAKLKEKNA